MRTKTLLIAAAALAVGIISSEAQVYSQNVVGYVNLSVAASGYTVVTMPLDYDGTGTNNTVSAIIGTNLPVGSSIQNWTGTGFAGNSYSKKGLGSGEPQLDVGQAVFLNTTNLNPVWGTNFIVK